jgi:hypothetical protein
MTDDVKLMQHSEAAGNSLGDMCFHAEVGIYVDAEVPHSSRRCEERITNLYTGLRYLGIGDDLKNTRRLWPLKSSSAID